MGKTGKTPDEEKPDVSNPGVTRPNRERAPKKIFSPTEPASAASRPISDKKTRSESSPVSSKSSVTTKKPDAAKSSRSSSLSFNDDLGAKADKQSTSTAIPKTTEKNLEEHNKSDESLESKKPEVVVKREIPSDSDDDANLTFFPSLAERVKRNRESLAPKVVATPPASSSKKKKMPTVPSKPVKKTETPPVEMARSSQEKVSSPTSSQQAVQKEKNPQQSVRKADNTGSQTSGMIGTAPKAVEPTTTAKVQVLKDKKASAVPATSKASSQEKQTTTDWSTLKEPEKTKRDEITAKTTVKEKPQTTLVSKKMEETSGKMKEIPKSVDIPRVQQESGPSRANAVLIAGPPVRTTILPQLTEEGRRLREETRRIQTAGVTEMEDRPPILPKVTEDFKKRLYDPYVRARMREELSLSDHSSADVENPNQRRPEVAAEIVSVDEPLAVPAAAPSKETAGTNPPVKSKGTPSLSFSVPPSKPNVETKGRHVTEQKQSDITIEPVSQKKDDEKVKHAGVAVPVQKPKRMTEDEKMAASSKHDTGFESKRSLRSKAPVAAGIAKENKDVVPGKSIAVAAQSKAKVTQKNDVSAVPPESSGEKVENSQATDWTPAFLQTGDRREKLRTVTSGSSQNDSSVSAEPESLTAPTASASSDVERLETEMTKKTAPDSDKKKKKKKKKKHSERRNSDEPSRENDAQETTDTPKGPLKFKISLKGSPTIKASTPCNGADKEGAETDDAGHKDGNEPVPDKTKKAVKQMEGNSMDSKSNVATMESEKTEDVSKRTRSSRNIGKVSLIRVPGNDQHKSTQNSAKPSPELGDAGLRFSYGNSKTGTNGSKLGKRGKADAVEETETFTTRQLRARRPNINASIKQLTRKAEETVLPYYTGPVKDLKPIEKHEPTMKEEHEHRTEAMTQAIRNALLSEPVKYEADDYTEDEYCGPDNPASLYYFVNDSYKWTRPSLENGKDYDPDEFEEVGAELPQLRDKKLACLDPDRDETFWAVPENREEYYDQNSEKVDHFLKQCQVLGIQIDRGLRHLHSHCGHNAQQAIDTIEKRAKNMVLYKPLDEREQTIFEEIYRAYGKNFEKISYFIHLPVKKLIQHYYKSKKTYGYKKLMLQNPIRIDCRISDGKFPGTCFFCKRKARTLKASRRYEGDEHPRLICMTCRTYRKMVNAHHDKWERIYQGNRNQEITFPICLERFTEKDKYRGESEQSIFDIRYPTDFNFLFHNELKPSFEVFSKIASTEQQRLKKLGLKVCKNDEKFDPKEDFCLNLKEFFKDPNPQPQEDITKIKEKVKETVLECRKIWADLLEMEDEGPDEDEEEEKFEEVLSKFRKMKKPSRGTVTEQFSELDFKYTLSAFTRYGLDFPTVAMIVKTKTPAAIEQFYKEHKVQFDEYIEQYHGQQAIEDYRESKKKANPKRAEYYDKWDPKAVLPDPCAPSTSKL